MQIINRKEAKKLGLKRYYTGQSCAHGHVCERLVSIRKCVECGRINARKWKKANPERNCANVKTQYQKKHATRSPAAIKAAMAWKKRNPGAVAANTRTRQANKLNATPLWANMEMIKQIYISANEQGKHVDHIIPLQGINVCGLHVENNLQILSPIDNIAKGNKY